jgi:hypothetical protein
MAFLGITALALMMTHMAMRVEKSNTAEAKTMSTRISDIMKSTTRLGAPGVPQHLTITTPKKSNITDGPPVTIATMTSSLESDVRKDVQTPFGTNAHGSSSAAVRQHRHSIVNQLTLNAEKSVDSCAGRANTILRSASWQKIDLKGIRQLEKNLEAHLHDRSALKMEGHSAQLQIEPRLYTAFAAIGSDCVKTVCEIGFNAGHSALRWLWAAPEANVVMFDLWAHASNEPAEEFIRNHFNVEKADERLTIIKGDSTLVVRKFHASNPTTKCNIISVDGGHSFDVALADIMNMRYLADSEFHVLFVVGYSEP